MANKYTYYRVIQEFWGEWCDSDWHEANSSYTPHDYKAFRENLKAYRENAGCPIRVVNRREKNEKRG